MKLFYNEQQSNNKQNFAEIKNHNHNEKLLLGVNKEKIIVQKTPSTLKDQNNPYKTKFKYQWIAKTQPNYQTINEIIIADSIRLLIGDDLSPKYRLAKDEEGKIWTLTKILENFKSAIEIFHSTENYDDRENNYMNITENLENFEQAIAIGLLFGKNDLHEGNWGIIEKNGKKYAALVDHGQPSMNINGALISNFMRYGHRKERILTDKFAEACVSIAKKFEDKKDQIKDKLEIGVKRAKEFYDHKDNLEDINAQKYIDILSFNSSFLTQLSHQIRAEIAIKEGNIDNFRKILKQMDQKFFVLDIDKPIEDFCPLSKQNSDGFIDRSFAENFIQLIYTRLEDDCDNIVFKRHMPRNSEKRSEKYMKKMTDQDRNIEDNLLNIYKDIAKSKNPNQSIILNQRKSNKHIGI